MTTPIKNRYDFVYLFDVKDGNPNGDPDQANLPRADAENQEGLITDVCIKRKVRNYIMLKHDLKSPFDIFIRQGNVLNPIIKDSGKDIQGRQKSLTTQYYDIRTFGAVLTPVEKEKEQDRSWSGTVYLFTIRRQNIPGGTLYYPLCGYDSRRSESSGKPGTRFDFRAKIDSAIRSLPNARVYFSS